MTGEIDGAELPSIPFMASLTSSQRYTAFGIGLCLLLLLGWWGGSGQDSLNETTWNDSGTMAASSIPPVDMNISPPKDSPKPSFPPGAGPSGPVVGDWGLQDTVLPNSLTFLSIGDWGRAGKGGQEITAPPLAAWAAATRASFVVSVGDNVYVDGVPRGSSPEEVDGIMRSFFSNVYTAPSLSALPFYAIFGNHDYRGDVGAQVAWKGDPRWRPGYNFTKRWKVGRGVGSSGGGCISAVFTDTSPLISEYLETEYAKKHPVLASNVRSADKSAIRAWTLSALRKAQGSGCSCLLVFGHHPLYSPGEHSNSEDLIEAYGEAMEEAGVDAYIAGHDHLLGHSRVPGGQVEHVLTGGGSEIRPKMVPGPETVWVSPIRGFTVHSINATHMATSYIWCQDGQSTGALPGRVAFHSLKPLRNK